MSGELHPTRGYIGGANIAGILGLSPFRTPLDEYLLICNELQDEITPAKERFFNRRKALEPFAAECFEQVTGLKIVRRNERYTDAEFPWMRSEVDFETADGGGGECKTVHPSTAGAWGKPEDGDEPPAYVTAQVMHGLGITGKPHAYVHALIGLDDDRIFRINRDDELIAEIRKQAERFWKYHVLPRRPPPPVNVDDLLRLYPRGSGRAVEADTETQLSMTELHTLRQRIKLLESQKALLEYQIKGFMRDATTLTAGGIAIATWKPRSDGVRVFNLKK
ncbi:YqaJ viral recombinase family nuclease [Rhodanobacter glycinis]|uniref:YqaJ viral recombinase family nuclease n=1 Tax=Rhodanobacter glycinis TaxID=582702 RepID=UPI001375F9A4|nr:YqaJ viral recombinase family protein [Rhodanobacter glycinis]